LKHHPPTSEVVNYRFQNPTDSTGRLDVIVARGPWGQVPTEFSYHWACALDDWILSPTHIVRAWDLESVADVHRSLFDLWNDSTGQKKPYPELLHTSLILMPGGSRMEKRSQAVLWSEVLRTLGLESLRQILDDSLDAEAIRSRSSERHKRLRYEPITHQFLPDASPEGHQEC
jgi:glutamyl/glutaminyl-tRNA synthetase